MRRRLHRDGGEHLHEVIDDDVAQRPDRIVEVAAVGDAEVLGHGDLHAVDVVAVPHGLEHRVREAQVEDLLEAHLAEVVVDPEDLRLVDVLRAARRRGPAPTARSWPNGFSMTTRPCSVRPASASPFTTVANRLGGISR